MTKVNSHQILQRHELFRDLPEAVLQPLAAAMRPQRLQAGEWAFREGDEAAFCLLVERGAVDLLRHGADGEERVFNNYGAGALVAELAMFMPHGRFPMNARVREALYGWQLPRQALRQACAEHGALAMRMLERMSARLYRSVNEVEWVTASNAPQRLAAYLMDLRPASPEAPVELPLSQRQLAARLGMRAETLSRLFADWIERGYVAGRLRSWRILAPAVLTGLSSGAARQF